MIESIEVQVISRLITTEDPTEVDTLLGYDLSYYSAYRTEAEYIFKHKDKYNLIPSRFDFLAQFPEFVIIPVAEPIEYLCTKLNEYKRYLILLETFNKIKDLGQGDVDDAWAYLSMQCEKADSLQDSKPMNIIKEAKKRSDQILEYNKQKRIPTGFPELDKIMYGGLSTVEELFLLVARTNAGKSWFCTRVMESAQKHGFNVAYYSPEMQASYLATRFDTWRGHFSNSSLYKGDYSAEYYAYLKSLPEDETDAYVIEDKDFPEGVTVRKLDSFVRKHNIQLLIIDGISYMTDDNHATRDQEKYKNIATGLFSLSKKNGCAVVLVMQANRDVKNKDDKGEAIPDLYNTENSDAPGRVATQAIGLRQIFDKHVLDIKLLKSRMAVNGGQIFSYAWEVGNGNMQFLGNGSDDLGSSVTPDITPSIASNIIPTSFGPDASDNSLIQADDEDIEF